MTARVRDQNTWTQFLFFSQCQRDLGASPLLHLLLLSDTKWDNTRFAYFYHGGGKEQMNMQL